MKQRQFSTRERLGVPRGVAAPCHGAGDLRGLSRRIRYRLPTASIAPTALQGAIIPAPLLVLWATTARDRVCATRWRCSQWADDRFGSCHRRDTLPSPRTVPTRWPNCWWTFRLTVVRQQSLRVVVAIIGAGGSVNLGGGRHRWCAVLALSVVQPCRGDEAVVLAGEGEVVDVGAPAPRPIPDVVDLAEVAGHVAAGCGAAAVLGVQDDALVRRGDAAGPAEI